MEEKTIEKIFSNEQWRRKGKMEYIDLYEWYSDEKEYFRFEKMQNLSTRAHFHGSWEFIFVLSGDLTAYIDGKKYFAEAGDVLFIPEFTVHYVPKGEKNVCYSVVFQKSYLGKFAEEYGGKVFETALKYRGAETDEIFRFVSACAEKFPHFNVCEKCGFVQMFTGYFAKIYPLFLTNKNNSEKIIVNILRYLENNFFEEIGVESVAEKFGYSKNYISSLFCRYTGMRFSEYLNRLRISAAMRSIGKERNEKGQANVSKIAYECGFNSLNTFYRAKKKYFPEERYKEKTEKTH